LLDQLAAVNSMKAEPRGWCISKLRREFAASLEKMAQDATKAVALVTGASYGVGAATALALARAGFDLALTATQRENLAKTGAAAAALGAEVLPLELIYAYPRASRRSWPPCSIAMGASMSSSTTPPLICGARPSTSAATNGRSDRDKSHRHVLSDATGRTPSHRATLAGRIITVTSAHAFVGAAERSTMVSARRRWCR